MPIVILPPQKGVGPFTKRWQEACRDALSSYCWLPENRVRGKPMGMTRLRDEIMERFDDYDAGKLVRATMLGREDLEHWMKGKNYLSDAKFQYVDLWLRTVRNTDKMAAALEKMIIYKEQVFQELLSKLYSRDYEDALSDSQRDLDMLRDGIFYSQILKSPRASSMEPYARNVSLSDYRQIALYFRNMTPRGASVTAVYMERPKSALAAPSYDDWTVCFGYLSIIGTDEIGPWSDAVLHMFRSEFPGGYSAGASVSEMTIRWYDNTFITGWYPQVCSQNITGYEVQKPPNIEVQSDDGFINFDGSCHFAKIPMEDESLGEFRNYVSNLTNRYMIW